MSEEESPAFTGFWRNVRNATKELPEPQRELLFACLWLGWLSTAEEAKLEGGFAESFTPERDDVPFTDEQAELLIGYHSAHEAVHMRPHLFRFIR
ncbi:hypothetical protein [Amycolatopsis australiensis]|uniref:Uncharacterized protein n=1 Tax=Amycolatopsis australiensis TaxID=546364 RepID=A0A1K1SDD8_9PSEU|nr:hypothetical protein [Amycolatopsis australiensis]SFW82334.1 hypothetical protein SAMN04489730_5389 [Amycolatopsis australiensis]